MSVDALIRTRKLMSNPLLSRKQMIVDIVHPGKPVLSLKEIRDQLAKRFKSTSDAVFASGFRTQFGGGRSTGFAVVYDSINHAKKFEAKYRLIRVSFSYFLEHFQNGLAQKITKGRKLKKQRKNKAKKQRGTHVRDRKKEK